MYIGESLRGLVGKWFSNVLHGTVLVQFSKRNNRSGTSISCQHEVDHGQPIECMKRVIEHVCLSGKSMGCARANEVEES